MFAQSTIDTLNTDTIPIYSTYYIGYDEMGNRTSRYILFDQMAKKSIPHQRIDEILDGNKITIYPNPTEGKVIVSIPILESKKIESTLNVINTEGKILQNIDSPSSYNEIDFTNMSTGVYVVRILIGKSYSEWRIIKK